MPNILLVGDHVADAYGPHIAAALAERGIAADLSRDHAPHDTDYIVLDPRGGLSVFTPYTRTRAVLSIWAGVEGIVGNTTLTQPLVRMVDPGMTQGMIEYVSGHVLRHHLGIDAHVKGLGGRWHRDVPKLASDRTVTVLGLGVLGSAVAGALAALGFPVTGWSRTPRALPALTRAFHGDDGLAAALTGAEIVVLLVPRTPATENLMNAARLALPARGAVLINPGRGALIDDDALVAALDAGQIGHATLDVFRTEPLPPEHPFWHHPRVTVTPHLAAETRPESAARAIAENIARVEGGLPLLNRVDRALGY